MLVVWNDMSARAETKFVDIVRWQEYLIIGVWTLSFFSQKIIVFHVHTPLLLEQKRHSTFAILEPVSNGFNSLY